MRYLVLLALVVTPASASSYVRTCMSIISSEELCGYRYPESVKTRFTVYATSELGVDAERAMSTIREQAQQTIEDVKSRGAVQQYCEDMQFFVKLANALR